MKKIAMLGGGNLGTAMITGFAASDCYNSEDIIVTDKSDEVLAKHRANGFNAMADNAEAVRSCDIIITAIRPHILSKVFDEIKEYLDPARHIVVSVVPGITCNELRDMIGDGINIVRVMPNVAAAFKESMTCIYSDSKKSAIDSVTELYDLIGTTLFIEERLMVPATALCSCGTAFFLRSIRAAAQGGVEIGFHAEQAAIMAAQTAKGAAAILLSKEVNPEVAVDSVTTPGGSTITGLNTMEHNGFSSAMIKGVVAASEKTAKLYSSS